MNKTLTVTLVLAAIFMIAYPAPLPAQDDYPEFTFGASPYAGWEPHKYGHKNGVLAKWAEKNKVKITFKWYQKYMDSVADYAGGKLDAVAITNMDLLSGPAASGRKSRVKMVTSKSFGNDGVIVRPGMTVQDLTTNPVYLVKGSVSDFLLARCLQKNSIDRKKVKRVDIGDDKLEAAWKSDSSIKALVTWNPMLQNLTSDGAELLFSSKDTPDEIQDCLVVSDEASAKYPGFGRALVGTWFELMNTLTQRSDAAKRMKVKLAAGSGCSVEEYQKQLDTTQFSATPDAALSFMKGSIVKEANDRVRTFLAEEKLFGENVTSADYVGIQYPDGTVRGDDKNVQVILDTGDIEQAASGQLD